MKNRKLVAILVAAMVLFTATFAALAADSQPQGNITGDNGDQSVTFTNKLIADEFSLEINKVWEGDRPSGDWDILFTITGKSPNGEVFEKTVSMNQDSGDSVTIELLVYDKGGLIEYSVIESFDIPGYVVADGTLDVTEEEPIV